MRIRFTERRARVLRTRSKATCDEIYTSRVRDHRSFDFSPHDYIITIYNSTATMRFLIFAPKRRDATVRSAFGTLVRV